jgi:hypothetical protein
MPDVVAALRSGLRVNCAAQAALARRMASSVASFQSFGLSCAMGGSSLVCDPSQHGKGRRINDLPALPGSPTGSYGLTAT